jgi:hypothetical protein
MKKRGFLTAGGILMILLGLVRGVGGLMLVMRGSALDRAIHATGPVVVVLGAVLMILGAGLIVTGVGVIRRRPTFWLAGILFTVAFLIDGAINGTVLYGRPGAGGTFANAVVAILILACVLAGRRALEKSAAQNPASAPQP